MADDTLVREARSLGFDERNARLLALLPMVHYAWQGGELPERRAVRRMVGEGFGLEPSALATVDSWLAVVPSPTYLARARGLHVALMRRHRGRFVPPGTRPELLETTRMVLRAVTSLYALRRHDARDEEVLATILEQIGPRQGPVWPEIGAGAESNETWQPDDDLDPPTDVGVPVVRPTKPEGQLTLQPAPPRAKITLTRLDARISTTARRGTVITMGRTRGNTCQILDDGEVSRFHCKVFDLGGLWIVEDLGSMNGTRIDGEVVSVRQLFGGEELVVGNGIYKVELEE